MAKWFGVSAAGDGPTQDRQAANPERQRRESAMERKQRLSLTPSAYNAQLTRDRHAAKMQHLTLSLAAVLDDDFPDVAAEDMAFTAHEMPAYEDLTCDPQVRTVWHGSTPP